ncbi:MAG TPA: cupredoxin domain-containing protein [Gemmatimonadales bacterium]|nr:cupredoxin domain-containing protein [Gemmatimonadales bacterium]
MNGTDWLVLIGGLTAIALVNWWFFRAGRTPVAAPAAPTGGPQEVVVAVRGGYDPGSIRVRAGLPVRLVFDRQEDASCSEEVVFPDFGVRKFLPPFARTSVEFTPAKPGTYEFTCGMSMLRGRLVVE